MSLAQDEIRVSGCGFPEAFLAGGHAELQAERPAGAVATHPAAGFMRHVVLHSLANLGALVGNGLLVFLLPRWLSMERYGYYRLFILYGGFAGVLHFGLLDGALVRWAARSRPRMSAELRPSLIFLTLQHASLLVPAMALLILWFRHRPWFLLASCIAVYALVWNAAVLGQFALQAKKSFDLLSAVTVINPVVLLAIVGVLKRWGQLRLETLLAAYLGTGLAAGIAVWVILLEQYPGQRKLGRNRGGRKLVGSKLAGTKLAGTKRMKMSLRQVWLVGTGNIAVGWSILAALLVTNLALSLDRIAVSLSCSIRDFAIYSLAANALAVVNTIILSISRVVFPYLADGIGAEFRIRAYAWGEATLMVLWALSLAGYFPLRLLIERLLPAYQPSLPILRLLMLSTGLTAAIYILHANYFRSSLRLGALLVGAGAGLAAAALFLALARHTGKLVNMSWAMLGAVALWWSVDESLLRREVLRTPLDIARTLAFTLTCGFLFLLCASISNRFLGVLVYGGLATLLTAAVYRQALRSLPRWGRWSMVLPWFGGTE
jgi:O-antigen/teichoic acid export membrane protein